MSQWNQSRRDHNRRPASSTKQLPLADALLKVVDLCLAAVVFVGPHLFGGRHLLGRFAILSLCVVAAIAWCLRLCLCDDPRRFRHYSFAIILSALGVVAFQLAPLPQSWIAALAPAHAAVLPLWNADDSGVSLGLWQTLSLSPEDTRLALATLVAYALLFFTAVQRIKTFSDVKRITGWIASSAIIVAILGVIQYFTANGKFFWLYEHPYVDSTVGFKAGFTNKNHFAHFLVLGLANLLAWAMLNRAETPQCRSDSRSWGSRESSGERRRYSNLFMGAAVALLVFGVFASLSRGGILAGVSATAVVTAIYAREKLLKAGHLFALATLMLLIVSALSMSGNYETVARRLETFTSYSVDDMDTGGARRAIWTANIEAFQASPITGWGAGTHRFVYPLFIDEPIPTEFTHAESGFLQVASETGLPGLILLAAAIVACSSWCIQTLRCETVNQPTRIVAGGIAAALTASLVHSIVDFVWFIPACMTTTILLAACALRLSQLTVPTALQAQSYATPLPLTRFNLALAVSLSGIWAVLSTFPAAKTSLKWDAYVRADRAIQFPVESKLTASASRLEELAQAESLNREARVRNLIEVVQGWPNSGRAHARLAGAFLNRFEQLAQDSDNSMTIGQIREAAIASRFQSPAEVRTWLSQAFGENTRLLYLAHHHALRALQLCPLQGESYFYLAELAFLKGNSPRGFTAYAEQGLRVRPHDSNLLFSVGTNYLVNGNIDQALQMWMRAYKIPGAHQLHIIDILAGRMTADAFLKTFAPDWRTLEMLWSRFRQVGTAEDLQRILPYAADQARREVPDLHRSRAGRVWLGLAQMQLEMNEPREALASLQLSYASSPESVSTRRNLGKCLLHFQQYEAAESHLRWCTQKHPENLTYRAELLQATRAKMQQLARATHTSTR